MSPPGPWGRPPPNPGHRGLCATCAHVRVVGSARGATFFQCRLAQRDARFPKYPPQPVVRCAGHAPAGAEPARGPDAPGTALTPEP